MKSTILEDASALKHTAKFCSNPQDIMAFNFAKFYTDSKQFHHRNPLWGYFAWWGLSKVQEVLCAERMFTVVSRCDGNHQFDSIIRWSSSKYFVMFKDLWTRIALLSITYSGWFLNSSSFEGNGRFNRWAENRKIILQLGQVNLSNEVGHGYEERRFKNTSQWVQNIKR